jgi:predicted RNA-binding protein associated with RNAse of E/G family
VFVQELVLDTPEVKVSLARDVPFDPPIRIHDRVALEKGADAVWFTFPGAWHDIGRFHRADDSFTGIYANILTPPVMEPWGRWQTTDLFLDIWVDHDGILSILDEDQLEEAVQREWISRTLARRAREEAQGIRKKYEAGRWPPPVVEEWDLARARQASSDTTQAAQRRPTSR